MTTRRYLVGYDGSAAARAAAWWALDAAARADAPVELLYVYEWPPYAPAAPFVPSTSGWPDATTERQIGDMLSTAAAEAAGSHPSVPVTTTVVHGLPAHVLAERSRDAALVVLGNHGHSAWSELLLGSVSLAVTAHAHCPVVVVRDSEHPYDSGAPVVVGVDNSPYAHLALGFGYEEAASRDAPLTVVRAWQPPVPDWGEGLVDADAVAAAQRAEVAELMAGWAAKYPAVPTRVEIVTEHPARALVRASATAQLVVVGSRGRGGLRGLLLGSVSQHLLHHGRCPVAVVREAAGR